MLMMRMMDADEDKKDKVSSSKSNFVVCIESRFPDHFANIDSKVFDQIKTGRNECPCVDCETRGIDLRGIE